MVEKIAAIGHKFVYDFGPNAIYELYFVDPKHLEVTVVADASYPKGTLNKFDIDMNEIRPNVYIVTWIEPKTGNTVTHVEDYEQCIAFTNITDIASRQFWRFKGKIRALQ
jgi:hypothetical protein